MPATWMVSGCGRPPKPTTLELIYGCNRESPKEQELDENGNMRIGREALALGTGVQSLVRCPLHDCTCLGCSQAAGLYSSKKQ